jgi:hypothetical protein
MGRDGGASGSRRESGSAGGASSSGDQVAASSAGGTWSVNVFQGSKRPSARTSTKAGLFKKIDGWVYPGRDGKESTDTKEKWERFAKCAVGTHGGASGYSRMSALRQRTGVKKAYDTLQSYQCVICLKNLASSLAMRLPVDNMKLFVPGEERLSRGDPMKYHAVFSEAHATELSQSGFTQVAILFHPPDLALEGLSELAQEGGGSGRPRKRQAASRQVRKPKCRRRNNRRFGG